MNKNAVAGINFTLALINVVLYTITHASVNLVAVIICGIAGINTIAI